MPVIDEDKYSGAPGYRLLFGIESRRRDYQETHVMIRSTSEPSTHSKMVRLTPEGYTFRTFQGWRVLLLCAGALWLGVCLGISNRMALIYIPFWVISIIAIGLVFLFKLPKLSSKINTTILVNKEGVTCGGELYPWKNIYGSFIVERMFGKTYRPYLALVMNDQQCKYIYIHGAGLSGVYQIATAIYHYRPSL